MIHVNLRGCKTETRPFWEKVGFKAVGQSVAEELPAASGSSARSRILDFVDAVCMSVKDKRIWEAYVQKTQPEKYICADALSRATIIDDDVLQQQWSKRHFEIWDNLVIQRLIDESKVGGQKLTGGPAVAIQRTGSLLEKVASDLIGTRVTVKGNGSCWLYAFMAGYGGMLDHANPCVVTKKNQVEKAPSNADIMISKTLILAMQTHVLANKMPFKDDVELALMKKEIGALKAATRTDCGTPGADSVVYGVLANLMQVKIVCLDLSLPQWFRIAKGDEKGNFEERCSRTG